MLFDFFFKNFVYQEKFITFNSRFLGAKTIIPALFYFRSERL